MNRWKYEQIYQYLKELLYHARAVMIAVMLSFVSTCVQEDYLLQRKKSLIFLPIYAWRNCWELCLAYILGCICSDPEYETTCNGFKLCAFTKGSFIGQQEFCIVSMMISTVNVVGNLCMISL